MDFHGSSSSGDMFDSQGFQDFLNAQDSSEEDLLMKKPEKKPNPTLLKSAIPLHMHLSRLQVSVNKLIKMTTQFLEQLS